MKRALALAAFVSTALTATPANALLCDALLGCSCSVSATTLNFGTTINPLGGAPATATSDVTVACGGVIDLSPSVTVKFNGGQWGSITDRQMKSTTTTDRLHYNLYNSTLYSTIYGDGTGGNPTLTISGGAIALGSWSGTTRTYGQALIPANTKPQTFTDTITMRIDW